PPVLFFLHVPPPCSSPLSLHDALPIFTCRGASRACRSRPLPHLKDCSREQRGDGDRPPERCGQRGAKRRIDGHLCLHHLPAAGRSEEHTSELQSLTNLVCRLLLENKKP